MKKEVVKIIPTADLLEEMDQIQLHGGAGTDNGGTPSTYFLAQCEVVTHTFCSGGNCVPQCSCQPNPNPNPNPGSTPEN